MMYSFHDLMTNPTKSKKTIKPATATKTSEPITPAKRETKRLSSAHLNLDLAILVLFRFIEMEAFKSVRRSFRCKYNCSVVKLRSFR